MCENKFICFLTSCSDVCIVCQFLKHSESNIVSEQCQWPGTGLGSSLHVNLARSRSADRCIWQWGEKRITRMSQLHLDCAGELSVCDKSCPIKQEICLRGCQEPHPCYLLLFFTCSVLVPICQGDTWGGLPAACSGGTKDLQPWAPPVTVDAIMWEMDGQTCPRRGFVLVHVEWNSFKMKALLKPGLD